ncbi:MAG: thioredoxin family protein [Nitrospiraceae bacterium]|nr:thioredoxin family protein [Nitrospiraceae bacterium]
MKKIICLSAVLIMLVTLAGYSAAAGVDAALDGAKKAGKAVMLELGSAGCGPCEQMKPVMEKLKEAYKGRLEVIFVDVRKDRDAARRFSVFAIPTQVFLDRNGKEFHRHMGFYGYEEILPVLEEAGI